MVSFTFFRWAKGVFHETDRDIAGAICTGIDRLVDQPAEHAQRIGQPAKLDLATIKPILPCRWPASWA